MEYISVRDDSAKILMLDDWMFSQHFSLIHLDHSLHKMQYTPITFSHDAAPLMLFSTGEDSAKETCFLTSTINFMQFIYMNSSAYFSIKEL